VLFSHQLSRTALCYCWGSCTIVSQEGPSYKPSKGKTIRFWINPNKQHLSFSSLFTPRKVLLAKHQQAGVSSIKTSPFSIYSTIPLLFFLYLHCNAHELWMVSMLETNEFGSSTKICINSAWSVYTTAQSYVSILWGKIRSKRGMHFSCNCVQLARIAHRRNEVTISSLVMSHIFDAQCSFNLSTWYMSATMSK
jgi:hypothetical protein